MWFFCYLLYEIKAFYAKNKFVLFIVILFCCNSWDKNGTEKRDTHLAVHLTMLSHELQITNKANICVLC